MSGNTRRAVARSRGPGWMLIGASIVGLVVGIGVGLRGLRSDDLDTTTLLGLMALAGGVASLVLGMARVLGGRSAWAKAAGGVALVTGVSVVVWMLAPAVIASYVPDIDHAASPEQYGLEAVEVTYRAADGVEMSAWYVEPDNGSVVIFRHGSGSTASSVLGHAALLVEHGYGALVTDARGHGNSGGRGMDFGWFGTEDIAAAIDFLERRPEVDSDSIVVIGMSMGGEEAIGAIGEDPRIRAVVAEGASARTHLDKAWLSDVYGWRGWLQERIEWAQYSITDLLTPASMPGSLGSSARQANPRPLLLIAGGEMPDETNAAEFIAAQSPNVEVWVVPGAGHIGGLTAAPEEWEQVVVRFLEEALGVDR